MPSGESWRHLRGAGAVRVSVSDALTLPGAGDPWAGALCSGSARALPFAGSWPLVGPVGLLKRR